MPLFEQDKMTPKQTMRLAYWEKVRLLHDIHQDIKQKKQQQIHQDSLLDNCINRPNSFIG